MKRCPLCGRIYADLVENCPLCVQELISAAVPWERGKTLPEKDNDPNVYPFRWKIGIDDPSNFATLYAGPPKLPETPPEITIDL